MCRLINNASVRDHIDYNVDPSVKTDFTYDFVFAIQELYMFFRFFFFSCKIYGSWNESGWNVGYVTWEDQNFLSSKQNCIITNISARFSSIFLCFTPISIMINCWCEIIIWKDLCIMWNSKPKKDICFIASPLVYNCIYIESHSYRYHNTFWWGLYILLEVKVKQTLIRIIQDFK